MTASALRSVILTLSLAGFVCCFFLTGLSGDFIFDDQVNIIENTALHVSRLNLDNWLYAAYSFQPGHGSRSLSMLSFAFDFWRGNGLDPRVFKTTSLLVHGLTVMALLLFFQRLLALGAWQGRRVATGAILLTLAWALHPLQVSSVLYVVQRMQTLCTLFMVLALWAYLGMRQAQIEGLRSRLHGVLTLLFWVLGFAAKEDAVLFPLYACALELTVLRFRAHDPRIAKVLQKGYRWLVLAGVAAYFLIIMPRFWSWQAYPGRDFNSIERLLSQGRALAMYLGQIVLPLPGHLPFYYDDFEISRSLWKPPTTAAAWLLVVGLLVWAWRWRTRRPLFSLGIFLFFAGHFMTSNVIGLELAFEHRNHLPLVGAVLSIGDLAMAAWQRARLPARAGLAAVLLVLACLGWLTFNRAHDWGDTLRLSNRLVEYAPQSERTWLQLAGVYARRSGWRPDSPDLARTIAISEEGAALTQSLPLYSNIVINKTIRGDVTPQDWARFLERLGEVPMSVQNRNTVWAMLRSFEGGIALDKESIGQAIEIVSRRWQFDSYENLRFGAFIHNETRHPDRALPYLRRAVKLATSQDAPDIGRMIAQLKAAGRDDWARELENMWKASRKN